MHDCRLSKSYFSCEGSFIDVLKQFVESGVTKDAQTVSSGGTGSNVNQQLRILLDEASKGLQKYVLRASGMFFVMIAGGAYA